MRCMEGYIDFSCSFGMLSVLLFRTRVLWLFPSQAEQMAGERHGGLDTKDSWSKLDDATTGLPCQVDLLRGPSALRADGHFPASCWIVWSGRDLLHQVFGADGG